MMRCKGSGVVALIDQIVAYLSEHRLYGFLLSIAGNNTEQKPRKRRISISAIFIRLDGGTALAKSRGLLVTLPLKSSIRFWCEQGRSVS